MTGVELRSFDTRFGKFEGIQQQHDQRLADIERRLGTLEHVIADFRVEVDQKQESIRAHLLHAIQETKTDLVEMIKATNGRIDDTNSRIDDTNSRIDGTNSRIDGTNSRIDDVRTELIGRIEALRSEFSTRIDKLNDKIDAQYRWVLGFLVTIAVAVVASVIRQYLHLPK